MCRPALDLSTHSAFSYISTTQSVMGNALDVRNAVAIARSGNELEAVVSTAVIIASHRNGFTGCSVSMFLSNLVKELILQTAIRDTKRCTVTWTADGTCGLQDMVVPYLAAANDKWPQALTEIEDGYFGHLSRKPNKEMIDFSVTSLVGGKELFTGECKNYSEKIKLPVLKECLQRMMSRQSKLHLVVVSKLQDNYFCDKNSSWTTYCNEEGNQSLCTYSLMRIVVAKSAAPNRFCISLAPLFKGMNVFPSHEHCEGVAVFLDIDCIVFLDKEATKRNTTEESSLGREDDEEPPARAVKKRRF